MSVAVELENVTKQFGDFTAVDNLSLQVPENTIYGFIGPNGSGKTTPLRMIMRIFFPDSGHIRVLGEETWKAASDRVAYLPEERGLYKSMKVREMQGDGSTRSRCTDQCVTASHHIFRTTQCLPNMATQLQRP